MDVRQLRYFVQIVESGSLSKAARQLFIVQPALSQQMARLEEEVGKPLLVRSVRGVHPTDNGEALYEHAKFVLRQLDDAVLVAREALSQRKGRVTLGLAPSTSRVLGLPLLRHIKEKYPGILLNVVVALPMHLEERARAELLDLAILFSKTAARELTFDHLLEEEVAVLVPRQSGLVAKGRKKLKLREVAGLPLVFSSPNHGLRRRVMAEFERAGLDANIVAEIDSLELVMNYVAEGGGATIQPMAAASAFGSPEQWRCLPIEDVPIVRPNYLYSLAPHQLSASAAAVRAEVRPVIRELMQSGAWRGVTLVPPADEIPEPPRSA